MSEDKCIGCFAHQHDKEVGWMCVAPMCIRKYDYDPELRIWTEKVEPKKGGCYQFTYCNECMAFPMGLGCENPNREEHKHEEDLEE